MKNPRGEGVKVHHQRCLEAEQRLQIDPPVGRSGREWPPCQRIRLAKDWRRHHSHRGTHIHVVEQILRRDAKRQAVSPVGRVARAEPAASAAPSAATTTAARSAEPTERAAGPAWTGIGGAFLFGAEAEGFAQTQVEAKPPRTGAVVNG